MSIAAALAVVLPATGLIIAVVLAAWNGLNGRIDRLHEPSRRLDSADWRLRSIDRKFDSIDHSLDSIESQGEEILRSLRRIEDHFDTQARGRRRHLRLVTLEDPPAAEVAEAT